MFSTRLCLSFMTNHPFTSGPYLPTDSAVIPDLFWIYSALLSASVCTCFVGYITSLHYGIDTRTHRYCSTDIHFTGTPIRPRNVPSYTQIYSMIQKCSPT